ncbi:3-deoxy-D-manno-octulosonic acid transferase [Allopusillimonas ginsengisoli]|uniref:3-deoxy-D-manno-octulosonic acid transferase n=1 Tax=Allopusillimonas ginsengisoli TaxID=453575 RepID=UPI0010202D76|nr:3-deoxy-D-manno-octulosonic acid transferase [Allopusillimonas ginsengisoli]TEA77857.1 3-deoxy-D-manno-octulosonic acid transferase [Allopusillimonas ginsengisoli]
MNRFLYTTLIRVLSPGLLGWMAMRARRVGGDWGVCSGVRFGRYTGTSSLRSPVWIHAVSLGETRAAQPLLHALLEQGEDVLLTHMTTTGRQEGARVFQEAISAGRLVQQWLPYDFPGATRRFIAHYRPSAGILIEREVWPNLLAAAQEARVPMMLASARFSDHALRQSLRLGSVMRRAYASFVAVYAQSLQDAQRLEQAGASAVRVSGNFKFDISLPADKIQRGREFGAALKRKVIVIASTREGEDELFIKALGKQVKRARAQGKNLSEQVLFCLVPRHPERFDTAATQLSQAGISYVRRSQLIEAGDCSSTALRASNNTAVLLGDSLGEMLWYYALAQVAVVAGSFQPLGGQNLIEACAIGTPVIVGPHTRNFEQAVVDAMDEGAALRAPNAEAALQLALQLLDDPQRLSRMGQAGTHWVQKHAGAVVRVTTGLNEIRQHGARP